jgi:hypothetical protein
MNTSCTGVSNCQILSFLFFFSATNLIASSTTVALVNKSSLFITHSLAKDKPEPSFCVLHQDSQISPMLSFEMNLKLQDTCHIQMEVLYYVFCNIVPG